MPQLSWFLVELFLGVTGYLLQRIIISCLEEQKGYSNRDIRLKYLIAVVVVLNLFYFNPSRILVQMLVKVALMQYILALFFTVVTFHRLRYSKFVIESFRTNYFLNHDKSILIQFVLITCFSHFFLVPNISIYEIDVLIYVVLNYVYVHGIRYIWQTILF